MSDEHVREIRVRGSLGPRAFYGTSLAEVTTETPLRPRWIEIALYREWEVERDGAGQPVVPVVPVRPRGYVLHRVGRSLVYHVHDSGCHTGVETGTEHLGADCEPCLECRPPELAVLPEDAVVDLEEDRHAVDVCASPEQVLDLLQDPRAPAGPDASAVDRLSAPAQRLLRRAAAKDQGIAEITEVVQWLLTG